MLGASQEWEAGNFPWSHPMQLAQTLTMMMHNDGGGDGDDSATFHLFGAAFLNPGCTLESPQVFFVCLFVLNTLSEPHPKRVILEL